MERLTKLFFRLLALLTVEAAVLWLAFVGCLLLFLFMANTVFVARDTVLDEMLFRFASSHASPQTTRVMKVISFFASAEYLMVVPPLVVLVFSFFERLRWYGLKVLLISLTSTLLNQAMKRYFERPRPAIALLEQSGLSFPSGHAMIGGSFYGLLIYIVWQTVASRVWRWVITILLSLLLLLIGYSRVYLKVHYATDVLAGYAMGLLWLILSVYLLRKIEGRFVRQIKQD
ncbi:phosphatase PAP2 family protein [Pontibacter sp. E15-1]|uniref:phosphatase PAP2 family protein n=1 Tax=Pontibacter sp. E15-1 TaxID=2919918 RepID=UPI001F4FA353|nr:phosphatase PAP2 family protein [Pontibacter sp. E15-1]MCJ8165363.1 phosphatase PAP2 family protein [Pontibacter sp. E15-1]